MDSFDFISPLDYRYIGRDKDFAKIAGFFSENSRIKYQAKIELALIKALAARKVCSQKVVEEVEKAIQEIKAEEVYNEEDITKHDIKALVNVLRSKVSEEAKPFIHLTSTSYDIVDTANSLRFKEGTLELLIPALKELEKTIIELALREKETVQIGRTHGQHAEPITFGYFLACYASRIGQRIKEIEARANSLKGKFSGAVGAYNASSLFFDNALEFEKEVLAQLGLLPSESSTQIIEPEPLTDLSHAVVSCFGVLANLADDLRHLQRSEIAEVAEAFDSKQVGSSTMPHKRNPINFENVKSFYKEFMPRMTSVYLDQISEHQRDLTNSASQRFLPELFVGFYSSVKRMDKILSKLVVDKENMRKNFETASESIIAEPLYLLFAFKGHPDAHEFLKQLTLKAQQEKKPLIEIIKQDKEAKEWLEKLDERQKEIALQPEKYIGKAVEKTGLICEHWKKELKI
ncbi:MAG: lyase family protein [Candidatus Diapherotrites archaeon]|nr:lyase family protein [Candidatus Diapherotrites archaeon]